MHSRADPCGRCATKSIDRFRECSGGPGFSRIANRGDISFDIRFAMRKRPSRSGLSVRR